MKIKRASLLGLLVATCGVGAMAQGPLNADGGADNSPEASRPRNPPELAHPRNPPEASTPLNPPNAPSGTPPQATVPVQPSTPISNVPPGEVPPPTTPTPGAPTVALWQTLPLDTVASQVWEQVRSYTFADRARFLTTFSRFRTRVEQAITEIEEKRLLFKGEPSTWDAQMKRLKDDRAYLDDSLRELSRATSANWSDAVEQLETAWEKFETTYERTLEMAPK